MLQYLSINYAITPIFQFLVNFSRLMRLILENSPKEFIPIELEREILDKYLTAQKMRFEHRFEYELTVSDDLLFNKAITLGNWSA